AGLPRGRELAIRLVLGAGIRDLGGQLTLESLLLSAPGGALGIVFAVWILRTFIALAGTQLPRAADIAIDGRVLAFTAAISLLVGIICGLSPLALLRMSERAAAVREGGAAPGRGAGNRIR